MKLITSINELSAKSVHVLVWPFSFDTDGTKRGFEKFEKKIKKAGWENTGFSDGLSMPDRNDDIDAFKSTFALRQSLSEQARDMFFSKHSIQKSYTYSRLFVEDGGIKKPALFYFKTPEDKEYFLPITGLSLQLFAYGVGILMMEIILPDEKKFSLENDPRLVDISGNITKFTATMKEAEAVKMISDIETFAPAVGLDSIPDDFSKAKLPLEIGIIDARTGAKYTTSFQDIADNINSLSKDFDGHKFNQKNLRDIEGELQNGATFYKDIVLSGVLNAKEWEVKGKAKKHGDGIKVQALTGSRLVEMSVSIGDGTENRSMAVNADTKAVSTSASSASAKNKNKIDRKDEAGKNLQSIDAKDGEFAEYLETELIPGEKLLKKIIRSNASKDDRRVALQEFLGLDAFVLSLSMAKAAGIEKFASLSNENRNIPEEKVTSTAERSEADSIISNLFSIYRKNMLLPAVSTKENANELYFGLNDYFGTQDALTEFEAGMLPAKESKEAVSDFSMNVFILIFEIILVALICGSTMPGGAKVFFVIVSIVVAFFLKEIAALLSEFKKFLSEHVHIDFKK